MDFILKGIVVIALDVWVVLEWLNDTMARIVALSERKCSVFVELTSECSKSSTEVGQKQSLMEVEKRSGRH